MASVTVATQTRVTSVATVTSVGVSGAYDSALDFDSDYGYDLASMQTVVDTQTRSFTVETQTP